MGRSAFWRWVTWAAVLVSLIVVGLHACALGLENELLLHPDVCSAYSDVSLSDVRSWIWLPSGALVVPFFDPDGKEVQDHSTVEVLYCHGNAGNLDSNVDIAEMLARRGYRVFLLEYAGFGVAATPTPLAVGATNIRPTTESLVRDVGEAWRKAIRRPHRAILIGFSIGGGAVAHMLRSLAPQEMPAQVVLINTFCSLPTLVGELVPVARPILIRIMRTQWHAPIGLARLLSTNDRYPSADRKGCSADPQGCSADPQGCSADSQGCSDNAAQVLIVATDDDGLIGADHALQIRNDVAVLLRGLDDQRLRIIRVSGGGHMAGPIYHFAEWARHLIPAISAGTDSPLSDSRLEITRPADSDK